jgi:hypothetical protein
VNEPSTSLDFLRVRLQDRERDRKENLDLRKDRYSKVTLTYPIRRGIPLILRYSFSFSSRPIMAMTTWASRIMGDMTEWTRCLAPKDKEAKRGLPEITIGFDLPYDSVKEDDLTSTLEAFSVVKFRPKHDKSSRSTPETEPSAANDHSSSGEEETFDESNTKKAANGAKRPKERENEENALGRDYDINPTKLYVHLRKRQWNKAIKRLKHYPDEAKIWTYRSAGGSKGSAAGDIRWRLTPLHGAIVYQSPLKVVEALLKVYPEAAALIDDQGSLPIHLAHKRGSPSTVVKLLLDTYPDCIDVTDRKGRTPTNMATTDSSSSPYVDFVLGYKEHIREQQKHSARLDTMLLYEECNTSHDADLTGLENRDPLVERLENKESVIRTPSKINHHLANLTETEASLLAQVMALDRDLKRIENTKSTGKAHLVSELTETRQALEQLRQEKYMMKMTLEAVVEAATADKKKLTSRIEDHEHAMQTLLQECELAREHSTKLEKQLQERESNERLLASEISLALARFQNNYRQSQHSMSSQSASSASSNHHQSHDVRRHRKSSTTTTTASKSTAFASK